MQLSEKTDERRWHALRAGMLDILNKAREERGDAPVPMNPGSLLRDPMYRPTARRNLEKLAAAFDKGPEAYEAEFNRLFPKSSDSE